MVTDNHYRWDFIGLSTDTKPTPTTSPKVVNGSTYYCSDTSKLYIWYKDQWYERKPLGGGGGGGTDDFEQLENRPKYNGTLMTGSTDIPEVITYTAGSNVTITNGEISATDTTYTAGDNITITNGEISATDTTYSAFTGTDGTAAGTAGLVPAPATTDAGKFLKADGTWDTAGGGGGGDSVYSTKTTSNSATGGAVYIGNLGTDQTEVQDPSPSDNHYKYFWALPYSNNGASYGQPGNGSITIMGSAKGLNSIAIGLSAGANSYGASYAVMIGSDASAGPSGVSIGSEASTSQDLIGNVCIGNKAVITGVGIKNSICLGRYSTATRSGELNIGTSATASLEGFNNTAYRVIGGVHDGQELHDAATVAQGNTLSTSAPTTSTEGVLGQLYTDTTNMHTYQCTAISGNTYTWTQRW